MDIIINTVSVLCSCRANNRRCYLLDLQENKEDLNNALEKLRATRTDVMTIVYEAENINQKRTPEVDYWLRSVQTIVNEVFEVIQKTDKEIQEIQGRCFGGNCPINCWRARKIDKFVLRKLQIVESAGRQVNSFGEVTYTLHPLSVQFLPTNTTVGMMFDAVWRLLAEDEVRIMGLYGYGGVGKTTLLKQINNEFLKTTTTSSSSSRNTLNFDIVIFVVVSKPDDAIQNEIGERLGSSPNRTSIFNALSKKRFLLLLDDIWGRVDLQVIGIPPPSKNNMSKVIFTTRSETVCGHMKANKIFRVKCLPWDEAWILFQEKVGNEALNSHPKVPELAKIVAKECDGLPLALITIGRAMSSKKTVHEWNHAIDTLQRYASEFPGMGDEVLPILNLSYDSLRNYTIKSCFRYCALFPKDESISIQRLVDYWIGEGLISLSDSNHLDEARNHGRDIIEILKGASLLENGEDEEETQVKMNAMIRNLALWITHEWGSSKIDKMLIIETSDLMAERWYNVDRIYLRPPCKGETKVGSPPDSPNLLTLILHDWTPGRLLIPQNFFEYMPHLRVLDLSLSRMKTFPISITELVELRYLSLSSTEIKELPEELGKLVKLNYLDLSYMNFLMTIPSGVIGSLLELRVLSLYCCPAELDVEEMYKLKHLNDLGITINTEHSTLPKLLSSSNKNLQMCTRHLQLRSPPSLSTTITTTTTTTTTTLLEKLELLSNLETLLLQFLPESNMGVWENQYYYMTQQHHQLQPFQNLSKIEIRECNLLKDLTWVGYLPNLKTLYVGYCDELEEIVVDDDFGGSTGGADGISMMMSNVKDGVFKRLKTLKLEELPNLKSICRNALAFPCLKSMQVLRCPQLKKLPLDSGSNVNNTLRKIEVTLNWWTELQWEEEDHGNNNELLKSKFLPYFHEVYVSYKDGFWVEKSG